MLSWVQWAILANYRTCGGGCGNLQFITAWSEIQRTTWKLWSVSEGGVGKSYGTEPLTCGVFTNSKQCQNWGHRVSVHPELENCLVCRKPCIWCQKWSVVEYRKHEFFHLSTLTSCPKDGSSLSFLLKSLKCWFCGKQYLLSHITEHMQPHFASTQTQLSL